MHLKPFVLCMIILLAGLSGSAQSSESEREISRENWVDFEKALQNEQWDAEALMLSDYVEHEFPSDELLKFKQLKKVIITGPKKVVGRIMMESARRFRIDTSKVKKLEHLQYLTLVDINCEEFPEGLLAIKQLKGLAIGLSGLAELPEEIAQLQSLEYLSLRLNYLNDLPQSLARLRKLEVLDLSNNKFTEIPSVLYDMPQLKKVLLGNPEGDEPLNWSFYPTTCNEILYTTEENNPVQLIQKAGLDELDIEVLGCEDRKSAKQSFAKGRVKKVLDIACRDCSNCIW